jgi:hypothetical protein
MFVLEERKLSRKGEPLGLPNKIRMLRWPMSLDLSGILIHLYHCFRALLHQLPTGHPELIGRFQFAPHFGSADPSINSRTV